MSDKRLYLWVRHVKEHQGAGSSEAALLISEIVRLKAEFKRTSEERDILKGRRVPCQSVREKYAFMAEHRGQFRLKSMRRVLRVRRSGHYAWKATPKSR